MPAERKFRVKILRGCIVDGEGVAAGKVVEVRGYDARAIVSAKRGEYVDGEPGGGMLDTGSGEGLIKKSGKR